MFGSGSAVSGLCPYLLESPREGREKGGLKEGERWPGPPRFMTDVNSKLISAIDVVVIHVNIVSSVDCIPCVIRDSE